MIDTPGDPPEPVAAREASLAECLAACPAAVIAVILVVATLVLSHWLAWCWYLQMPAMFVAGGVQRLNWRHVLVGAAVGGATSWVMTWLPQIPVERAFALSLLASCAPPMIVLGVMECLLRGRRGAMSLAIVIATCLAAAAAAATIEAPVRWSGAQLNVPGFDGRTWGYSVGSTTRQALEALLIWIAVPMGISSSRRGWRLAVLAGSLAWVTIYLVGFAPCVFALGGRSLAGYGPFSRSMGAHLVEIRGNEDDFEAMWHALAATDWNQSDPETSGTYWTERLITYAPRTSYRVICCRALAKHDRKQTARRFADLVLSTGNRDIASFSADLLADEQHYECVPILLRCACQYDEPCIEALEAMEVPQVAVPIVWNAYFRAAVDGRSPNEFDGNVLLIEGELRQRLIRSLGDAPAKTDREWLETYD